MFVYLFNFIVMIQPYNKCNFFTFPSRLDYISYRLLCGQGLIMACINSVFNKLHLEREFGLLDT